MIRAEMRLVSSLKGVGVFYIFHLTNIVISSIENNTKTCPNEFSTISNSSQKASWQSTDGTEHDIIVSDPPCIDESGNLVARVCSNGKWTSNGPPSCRKTVEATRRCPSNFQETETTCVYVTEPRPWEDNCKNISGLQPSSILTDEFVWLPFKRDSQYGPFKSVTWGASFGLPLDKLSLPSKINSFQKNCIVINTMTDSIELEDCNSLHKHICQFFKNETYNCPRHCVNAGIQSYDCYCKSKRKCKKLAEIRTIHQKNILSDLAGNDLCIVGGQQLLDGYSQALSKHRWLLTKEPVKCRLCHSGLQVRYEEDVFMILNFEEKNRKLYLVIYNPDGLYENAADKTVYCFTDAAPNDSKKRMWVTQIQERISNDNPYNVYAVQMETYIGQYWCYAYDKSGSDQAVHSNKVIGYIKEPGNEYALRLSMTNVWGDLDCCDDISVSFLSYINKTLSSVLDVQVRLMKIFTFDKQIVDVLLHLSRPQRTLVTIEYYDLKKKLESVLADTDIVYLKSSDYCLPETTERGISWPLTLIRHSAVPNQSCLQKNGLPVFRVCEGNFTTGAEWSSVIGKCDSDLEPSESSTVLQSVLNETITDVTIDKVTEVMEKEPDLPVLSIYYIAKILETIFLEHKSVGYNSRVLDEAGATLNITNGLLNVEKHSLSEAQDLLNITDDILDTIDKIFSTFKVDSNVVVIQRDNVALHSTNPFLSNVSGVVVYYDDEKKITIDSLRRNETFETVKYNENFKLAFYVPEEILEHFKDNDLTIVTTVFSNDNLFVSNHSRKPAGIVLSITIPEHGFYLPSALPILFKSDENDDTPDCGFWDYGKNYVRQKGRWSTKGGSYKGHFENHSTFHLCSFSHLTHFALLILEPNDAMYDDYDRILSIITYIGDFLSLCGILGIFLTAFVHKKWRQKQGTIILLNLSVAIELEIILTQLIEMTSMVSSTGCAIFGKIIHYIVVSKFSWMLVYSFLQYMRFVKVFNILPDNIVSISVIFGWGLAIIPVGIVAAVEPYSYVMRKYNFCYPSGISLYLGLMMPIIIIIFINTFVFFAIMRQVTTKTVESHGNKDNFHKLQIQLAALLFFVLGVPWIFGILSNVIPIAWIQTSLIYLFCITTNVQGFILFIFYVVFNNETRKFWLKYCAKKETLHISSSTKTSSK